jgi:hypothetical protein
MTALFNFGNLEVTAITENILSALETHDPYRAGLPLHISNIPLKCTCYKQAIPKQIILSHF